MFISLKWKAVVFLSIVLLVITSAWVSQSVYKNISNYDIEVTKNHQSHQQVLQQLMADNFLKLSQFSQLITDKPEIKNSPATRSSIELNRALQQQWVSLNINIGIDYLSILDSEGTPQGVAFNKELLSDTTVLEKALNQYNHPDLRFQPHSFIFCQDGCMQFIIEPFVYQDGSEGVIVLGQNVSDVIRRYHEITSSDLAIMIESEHFNQVLGTERFLPEWQGSVWALSRFESMFPILKAYSLENSLLAMKKAELFTFNETQYLFQPIVELNYPQLGGSTYFIDISDESADYNHLVSAIWSGILTGLLGLLVSELLLILMLLGPLQRLMHVAEALNLLPVHKYAAAQQRVNRKKTYVRDELTQLEDSTIYVSSELEKLHDEVELSSASLNKQVLALSRSRAFLGRLLDNANLFIITQGLDFKITSVNAMFENHTSGIDKDFLQVFIDRLSKQEFIGEIEALVKDSVFQHEVEMFSELGEPLVVSWTHTLVEDEQGQEIILSIGMDLTKQKQDESALKWIANNDSLTKIGNRRAFKKDLKHLLDSNMSGAIIFIDVNRFKQLNDLYGHVVGDRVLIDIAETLKHLTRSNDYISRLAGDEFTVILTGVTPPSLEQILEKIAKGLIGQITLQDNRIIEYSASLGAALFPEHGRDEQSLIVHADMAMYQAKKKGLDHWHIFDPADNNLAVLKKDHALTSLLRKAIDGSGYFHLVFQPILSMETYEIQHYEVLLRLENELGESVFPDEFIPAAERMGLIRGIDEWVICHAFQKITAETAKGHRVSFAINISAPTLQSKDFPSSLFAYFDQYQVDPRQVIIELTETAYIDNFSQVLVNLELIQKFGVKISLDDFGVGFSSFSYLKKLPLSYVKLDGSYIRDLPNNPDNQIFVESLSKMVSAFGMQTIAEFVEDEETLQMIKALGVSYGQGYHIGKPLPELLLENRLK